MPPVDNDGIGVVVAIAKWLAPNDVEWITQPESFAVVADFCNDPRAIHVWRFTGATKTDVTLAVYRHGYGRFGVGPTGRAAVAGVELPGAPRP